MPSYGTFSQMMINVGVNLSSLGTGLAKAKGQLAAFNAVGGQVAGNLSSSFGRTAGAIALISGAVYAMQQAFTGAIAAADEYRLATINIAATMTDWMDKGKKDQEDFNDHLVYAQEMYKVLELEAVKHFASGKDLQLAWTILTQKGVQLRFDEVEALGMVVDKIKLATQGQMSTIQIAQEIRSLLNGQARTTDQIALLLKDKYGKAWKEIVNEQRKSGTLLQWLSQEWDGLRAAQAHVLNTLEAQSTTLWTMIRRLGREGLAGAYQYIVDIIKNINKYLIEHENQISQKISKAWGALEPTLTAIGQAILRMITYVWGSGEAFSTAAGYVLFFTEAVIRAGESFFGFVEAHAWILKLIAGFIILNTVMSVIQGLISIVGTLVLGLIEAGVAIGAVVTAGMGLSVVASGFIGIGVAVVALVGLVLGAISVMEQFGIAAANAINRAKSAASFATGITQEEFQRRKKSTSYRGRTDPFEKVVGEGVQTTVPGSELLGPQFKKTYSPGTTAKTGTEEFNQAMASGRTFLAIDDKGLVRVMNAPALTPEESMELGKMALEGKTYKGRAEELDAGKGGKGGGAKAAEKLLGKELQVIKAQRELALTEWKTYLAKLESFFENEKELNDIRLQNGEITGAEYVNTIINNADKVYASKLEAIEKEKAVEEVAHQLKMQKINEEQARGAISPEKAELEKKLALIEVDKRRFTYEKEGYKALIELHQQYNNAIKETIASRKQIVDIAASLFQKISGGPITDQIKQLLTLRLEFSALEKQLRELKIDEKGEIKADPSLIKSAEFMVEAGKLLNADWAAPLAKAVEKLVSGKPGAVEEGKNEVIGILPQAQKTFESDIKFKKQIDSFVQDISSGISSITDALMEGGADLKKAANNMFKSIFKTSLQPGLDFLKEALTKGFNKLFEGAGSSIANAVMGVIGIVGMLLTSSKTSSSWSSSSIESGVTSNEAVRGIIAGETSISIAEISVSIREAFAASENYLSEIAKNTRGGIPAANPATVTYNQPVLPTQRVDVNVAVSPTELASVLKTAVTDAMESFFEEQLMLGVR